LLFTKRATHSANLIFVDIITLIIARASQSGGRQKGHLALASSSKDAYISKDLGDETIFLRRTYSVKF
jgi:hypothetical protein